MSSKPDPATGAAEDQVVPAFPMRAVMIGVAAMVLIAIASAAITWVVGSRIRTITNSQLVVLSTAERLQHQSELLESIARMAVASGDATFAARYRELQPQLGETLDNLEAAIRLPQNRATFAAVARAEDQIAEIEMEALTLAVANRRPAAERLLASPRYTALVRTYRNGLSEIEQRSRAFVDETRRETDRYLATNFGTSLMALLLIALAWVVLVRPARAWARQLGSARRRAESATQAKSEFLAVMSHEVRTPLNSIIGFADLLLTDAELKGTQRRQVELIQGAGAMLLTVVNDLLDFSKIEAGKIELLPEPFALETLIDNGVSIVRSSAEAKGLEMRVAIDPCLATYFHGDENRLRQVLLNLLNNAVKFTSEGLVSLFVSRQSVEGDNERIRFTVTDTGLGIDPDVQKQLFQPFSQADASITRRFGGTGLGLSISKRLVELMGGEIDFMSTPGQGSSFWFTVSLPVSERPDTYEPAMTTGAAAAGARILVAEDLPMNQELARAMLGRAGHHVEIANDGQEAVEAVQAHAYDLILMDIQMPRMDGITATRTIRRLPGAAGQVPIVAMTANVLPQQVAEFLAAGMNGHVAKPVRQRELQAAIASALASRPRAALEIGSPAPAPSEPEPAADNGAFDAETFAGVLEMLPRDRLATYLDALQADITTVAAPNAAEDTPTLIATAHKIISQAGMLGLTRLSERARTVEDAARAGEGVEAALTSFREAQGDVNTYARPKLAL